MIDNRVHHARTKHIKLRQNFVREHKDSGELDPVYIATDSNIADDFTKVLSQTVIDSHCPGIMGYVPKYS